MEVLTGAPRRRRWSAEAKARIVAEIYATLVGEVADRYARAKTQLFTWQRKARGGGSGSGLSEPSSLEPTHETAAPKEARVKLFTDGSAAPVFYPRRANENGPALELRPR